jgi:hypothetical protein
MRPGEASFMAGDYNGDLSQDIAVIVTPAPSLLSELNQEYPSFILRDPLTEASPASVVRAKTEPPQRMSIAADDVLLAIIHGFGPNGWRDPEATQTYLLKNVVGQNMSTESLKSLKDRLNGKPAPKIAGDVISERIGAAEGFIYYSGAYYRWYDPRSYKAEKPRVEVHSGARQ